MESSTDQAIEGDDKEQKKRDQAGEDQGLQRSSLDHEMNSSSSTRKKGMKVLVAVDSSDGSFYALKWSMDHFFPISSSTSTSTVYQHHHPPAQEKGDQEEKEDKPGTVILLHVQQPFQPYILPAGPAIYATTELVESVKKTQEKNSAALLARASEFCKGRAIEVNSMVLTGDPKDMICHAVEQTNSDLLVVGSRGLGKIKRAFIGSVSDYCAHHAKCPLLIVKPPK